MNPKSTLPQNSQPRVTPYDDIVAHHLRQQEPERPPTREERIGEALERAGQHRPYLEKAADGGDLLACIALLLLDRAGDVLHASGNEAA
jgi:hypothetical protein